MPLIVGGAALVLAGLGAGIFLMHRTAAPVPDEKTTVVSQPSMPEPPAANSAPEPVQAPQEEAAQVATQPQTQPVAGEQAQPVAAVAPIPAVVTSPAITDSRTESRNLRRQEKNAVATKRPDLSSSRRPMIPNLKMGSPTAPNKNLSNSGEGIAPMTDIASTGGVGGALPAGLLTSAGRISNQPASPSAQAAIAAAKTVRDPKLISSTRLVYPAAARQSNIQGSVHVSATIDADGKVVGAKALSGPLLLQQAAVDLVKQWKYSPGLIDGKPASSQVTVNVEFRLN
jgi:TonB family protein